MHTLQNNVYTTVHMYTVYYVHVYNVYVYINYFIVYIRRYVYIPYLCIQMSRKNPTIHCTSGMSCKHNVYMKLIMYRQIVTYTYYTACIHCFDLMYTLDYTVYTTPFIYNAMYTMPLYTGQIIPCIHHVYDHYL